MEVLDLKKKYKQLYNAPTTPITIEVPPLQYLAVNGEGNPVTSPAFHSNIEGLFALSYGLKFKYKKGVKAIDYPVMPLEGLWWMRDNKPFSQDRKDEMMWTQMIMQPEFITQAEVDDILPAVTKKKPEIDFSKFTLQTIDEGKGAQIMHIGRYEDEGPTIETLHNYIEASGGKNSGKHHEIYLGDPRKSAPEKLKTILRQPFI